MAGLPNIYDLTLSLPNLCPWSDTFLPQNLGQVLKATVIVFLQLVLSPDTHSLHSQRL